MALGHPGKICRQEPGPGAAGAVSAGGGHGRARRGAAEVELSAHAEPAARCVVLLLFAGVHTAIVILLCLYRTIGARYGWIL